MDEELPRQSAEKTHKGRNPHESLLQTQLSGSLWMCDPLDKASKTPSGVESRQVRSLKRSVFRIQQPNRLLLLNDSGGEHRSNNRSRYRSDRNQWRRRSRAARAALNVLVLRLLMELESANDFQEARLHVRMLLNKRSLSVGMSNGLGSARAASISWKRSGWHLAGRMLARQTADRASAQSRLLTDPVAVRLLAHGLTLDFRRHA